MTAIPSSAQSEAYDIIRARTGPTKVCTACDTEHPLADFPFRSIAAATLHSRCRAAQRHATREWYHANRDAHRAAIAVRNTSHAAMVNGLVDTWLEHQRCANCGEPATLAVNPDGENIRRLLRDREAPAPGVDPLAHATAVCRSCRQR